MTFKTKTIFFYHRVNRNQAGFLGTFNTFTIINLIYCLISMMMIIVVDLFILATYSTDDMICRRHKELLPSAKKVFQRREAFCYYSVINRVVLPYLLCLQGSYLILYLYTEFRIQPPKLWERAQFVKSKYSEPYALIGQVLYIYIALFNQHTNWVWQSLLPHL